VPTGPGPRALSYSTARRLFYAAHEGDGSIVALDPRSGKVSGRCLTSAGVQTLDFAPGGRWGFAANPRTGQVLILDTASNRVAHIVHADQSPDQITFSDRFAYVRQRGSANLLLIPLDRVEDTSQAVSVFDVPGGQHPTSQGTQPCVAASITQASGRGAALIANPADKAIYYYEEGMAAPRGSFTNYGRQPRAVLAIERSLRPRRPGVYETTARLPTAGSHDLIVLLDTPRVLASFAVEIGGTAESAGEHRVRIDLLRDSAVVRVGVPDTLRFRLLDDTRGTPIAGLADVCVLAYSPGRWQKRYGAEPEGEGIYRLSFTAPSAGLYYLYVASSSSGLPLQAPRQLVLEAKEGLE
jgi:hypothetical protein